MKLIQNCVLENRMHSCVFGRELDEVSRTGPGVVETGSVRPTLFRCAESILRSALHFSMPAGGCIWPSSDDVLPAALP